MINYDSIISAYNDKPTLMEWLKKVEEALKGASATSFSVNKKGNATISFQINFDDGTSLESGDIILQQGESVQSAAIVNGHLVLTLTNGDELDAGNLGAVSGFSIDASQHLIVTYQDGTTSDLGAIFNGNVNISGILSASSVSTPLVTSAGASVEFAKPIDVDVLTSSESSITAQKPVIEEMTGYTFTIRTSPDIPTGLTLNIVYAGAVKNGNKLTLSIFGNMKRTGTLSSTYIDSGFGFVVPTEVGNKISTYTLGGLNLVDTRELALYSAYNSIKKKNTILMKSTLGGKPFFPLSIYAIDDLTLDTTYTFRYEITFLLGENLAA